MSEPNKLHPTYIMFNGNVNKYVFTQVAYIVLK